MTEATATVQVDKQGRLVLPQPARKVLGIDGESATVEVKVAKREVANE